MVNANRSTVWSQACYIPQQIATCMFSLRQCYQLTDDLAVPSNTSVHAKNIQISLTLYFIQTLQGTTVLFTVSLFQQSSHYQVISTLNSTTTTIARHRLSQTNSVTWARATVRSKHVSLTVALKQAFPVLSGWLFNQSNGWISHQPIKRRLCPFGSHQPMPLCWLFNHQFLVGSHF